MSDADRELSEILAHVGKSLLGGTLTDVEVTVVGDDGDTVEVPGWKVVNTPYTDDMEGIYLTITDAEGATSVYEGIDYEEFCVLRAEAAGLLAPEDETTLAEQMEKRR